MSTHQYKYTPLDNPTNEIRLVNILPGSWNDEIACELHTASLDEKPVYRTLSYVWGDASITKPILVDGWKFEVTTNLYSALNRLRCATTKKVIWIDALCIDQQDIEEKTSQVMLMGRIYEECVEVIIWLGDWNGGDSETVDQKTIEGTRIELESFFEGNFQDGAFEGFEAERRDTVAAFSIIKTLTWDKHFDSLPWLSSTPEFVGAAGNQTSISEGAFKALRQLLDVPYWNRIWVVQEMLLPASALVVFGSTNMSLSTYVQAALTMRSHINGCCLLPILEFDLVVLLDFLRTLEFTLDRGQGKYWDTLLILLQHSIRQATDPRDKVYGLLEILNRGRTTQRIKADYSISEEQLWLDMTWAIVESMLDLKVLTANYWNRAGQSWTIDFATLLSRTDARRQDLRFEKYALYDACNGNPLVAELMDDDMLKLKGNMFDTIASVGILSLDANEFSSIMTCKRILQLVDMGEDIQQNYAGGGTWEDAYWKTLRADVTITPVDGRLQLKRAVAKDKIAFDSLMSVPEGSEEERQAMYLEGQTIEDLLSMDTAINNRRLFVTRLGYLGLGTEEIQVSDEAYVINGSRVPFVLRRVDTTEVKLFHNLENPNLRLTPIEPTEEKAHDQELVKDGSITDDAHSSEAVSSATSQSTEPLGGESIELSYFNLIGDCYVHGIMDGEAAPSIDGRKAQVLVLC